MVLPSLPVRFSASKSWIANAALALTSVVVTLLAAEFALRAFHPVPFSIEKNMYFIADPYTGYRLKPGSVGVFSGGIPAIANRNGHRSDEIEPFKPVGVQRILVIGDSFTVGASVEQSETYSSVLQRLLNGDPVYGKGTRFEVINAGVGGWNPFQYAQYYQHYGPELEPDWVIVGLFVGNDVLKVVDSLDRTMTAVMGRRVSRKAAASPWIGLRVALHEHSHLARLVLHQSGPALSYHREVCDEIPNFLVRIEYGRRHVYRKDRPMLAVKVSRAVQQVARIKRLADQAGVRMLVVLLPDENQINPALQKRVFDDPDRYDLDLPQSLLVEQFGDAGIDVLDVLPSFRADSRCLYQNDTHWTAEGHALVAQQIYRTLLDRFDR